MSDASRRRVRSHPFNLLARASVCVCELMRTLQILNAKRTSSASVQSNDSWPCALGAKREYAAAPSPVGFGRVSAGVRACVSYIIILLISMCAPHGRQAHRHTISRPGLRRRQVVHNYSRFLFHFPYACQLLVTHLPNPALLIHSVCDDSRNRKCNYKFCQSWTDNIRVHIRLFRWNGLGRTHKTDEFLYEPFVALRRRVGMRV